MGQNINDRQLMEMLSAYGPQSSHAALLGARSKTTDPRAQAHLAPLEHRAFAREFAQESPLKAAVSLPFAIPAYSMAKALGLQKARSPASVEEVMQGFAGLGEGLGHAGRGFLERLQNYGGR